MTTQIKGLISCFGFDHPGLHIACVTPVTHEHIYHTSCQSMYMCSVLQDHTEQSPSFSGRFGRILNLCLPLALLISFADIRTGASP